MKQGFQFIRLTGDERREGPSLASVSRHWHGKKERFLFVSPHDDDAALGGGLLIQHAVSAGIPVFVAIVTNGMMGYCSAGEQRSIVEKRKSETLRSYTLLGVPAPHILWLNFPDCALAYYQGRHQARREDAGDTLIKGYAGLQNTFTYYLRKIRPTQCFIPTDRDLHPDHKYAYNEFLISVFHACGKIWPELGASLKMVPYLTEMAVYCDFPTPPQLRLVGGDVYFERKLKSILAFRSQKQIRSLVDSVRANGPVEFFRNVQFNLYNPLKYRYRFSEENHIFNAKYV
jgi:LmbE family N-acetylglucosaminyl deacetylase